MPDDRLSFKEMCAAFDVTPRTLRYYEYIELLKPDREGRARFYGPRERARMKLILRGRKFGFQLEDIRQWLLIYENEGNVAQMRCIRRTCRLVGMYSGLFAHTGLESDLRRTRSARSVEDAGRDRTGITRS